MNKKIFEDVKINSIKRVVKAPIQSDVVVDTDNHNPTYVPTQTERDDLSRYEFLKKKKISTTPTKRMSDTPRIPNQGRPFNKNILYVFTLAVLLGIVYFLSTVFLHANVTVIPKNQTFDLKHQKFTSGKSSQSVPFELMIVTDKEYRDIVLSNAKEVSIKAKGQIILYNEYSTKAQKITAGTFVSDEKGINYKTDTTVSIPPYTLDSSKKKIPGQVVVGITAFLPGDAYNGIRESFTINSFKGTDKFKKIYGKAKTAMEGGMIGLVYLMDEKEKANLNIKTSDFREKLVRKLSAQVPVGYILYPDAMSFTYKVDNNISSKTPDTKIEIEGSLGAFLLKESELSNSLIHKLLPEIGEVERKEIQDPNLSSLSFNFINKDQSISKDIESFEFELTGSLPLLWMPNEETLKSQLLGKKKSEVIDIFKQDKAIVQASVKIIPFWSTKLPVDMKNINIIIKK